MWNELGNDIKATAWYSNDPDTWITDASAYLPILFDRWGILWWNWYNSQGEEGEEPPDEVKQLFNLHEQLLESSIGSTEADTALQGIYKNHRTNIWSIELVETSRQPIFFNARIGNVPEGVQDVFSNIVNRSMEQWFIDE